MATLEDFTSQEALAVAGVSRHARGFGYKVWRHLQAMGIRAYPVNPRGDEVEGERLYPTVKDLPEVVGGVVTVVPPERTLQVIEDCVEMGITRIWMQPGSESDEAIALAEDKGMEVVARQCMLLL